MSKHALRQPNWQYSFPRRRNETARRFLSTVLILAGLAVLLYPSATEVYGYYIQVQLNKEWEAEAKKQQLKSAALEVKERRALGETAFANENAVLSSAVGQLSQVKGGNFPPTRVKIPKIGLEQVVFEGVDEETLKKGPGHYPGTANPGQRGNVGLAGHRVTYVKPFNRIDELNTGDVIVLETLDAVYEYKVVRKRVLPPDDISMLKPTTDSRLTLTTCTPKYSAKYRLDVQAILSKKTLRQKPTILRQLVKQIIKPKEEAPPKDVFKLVLNEIKKKIKNNPRDASAYTALGTLLRNMGRDKEAYEKLNYALELNPQDAQAHFQLALLQEKSKRFEAAVNEYKAALAADSSYEAAYFNLGLLFLKKGNYQEALNTFQQALNLDPLSADSHYYLGYTYESMKNKEEARKHYQQALSFIPDYTEAKAGLERVK